MTDQQFNWAEHSQHSELYRFAVDFFRLFDGAVEEIDRHHAHALHVALPPALIDHFGAPRLKLAFQHIEEGSDYELVAYGSRMFDRMIALLEQRSALTVQALPARFAAGEELLRAVQPVNSSIVKLRMAEQTQRLLVFNWHITYRADDKREELYTVVLDEDGVRLPQPGESSAPAEGLDVTALLADATPVTIERSADGQLLPTKLPPLTQLVRLAETARKYAVYHADLRCVAHEAEILPRLHKALLRLTTYYEQQIAEVYDTHDPAGDRRQALEADLQRKIAEEVENHRLHVQVKLFSYAVLQVPVAVAEITLSDGRQEATVRVLRNRYSGVLQQPHCHACHAETTQVALDRSGHITCDACLRQCETCLGIVCASCGVEPCPACGAHNCADCSQMCWACGGHACHAHISSCPVCGDAVCHACQAACTTCGVRQCRTHLRADSVMGCLVCGRCAVRCPGCHQYSAQLGVCSASGQRFCANCLRTCTACGRQVGPGFYGVDPVGEHAYCQRCAPERHLSAGAGNG